MWLLLRLLAFGIFPAVWLSGYALLGRLAAGGKLPVSPATALCLAPGVGMPVWSLAMALSAQWGLFHASIWGALGWIACLPLGALALRQRRVWQRQSLVRGLVLGAILASGFVLYAAFPHETFYVGRDQATYANQALHIARSGELRLDWPVAIADLEQRLAVGRTSFAATGVYVAADRLQVQFSPVLPIWLALAFSVFGIAGLQGFNAAAAALSAAVFFGVAARVGSRRVALAATALFALNPMQIWIARITLSEVLAQYWVLSGLLLMLLARRRAPAPHWLLGGVTLGASVLVRIDGFMLAPLGVAFAWLVRCVGPSEPAVVRRARNVGVAALLVVLALGVPFYLLTSPIYLAAQAKNLWSIAGCAAIFALFWAARLGRKPLALVLQKRAFWIVLAVGLAALALFAYFVRPRWEPFAHYTNPSATLYGERNHREDSFVNLGVYVTPLLAFAAVGGFWSLLRRTLTQRFRGALLLLAILSGGYALLYLYSPSISPDQPWGMRRFVPIVIPGVVLLAADWFDRLRFVLRRPRVHLALALVATAGVLGYAGYRSRAGLFLREYAGAYGFVSAAADAVPPGALLLCDVSPRAFGHMALGRGLRSIRFSSRDPARFAAAQAIVAASVPDGEPYYVLTDNRNKLRGEKPLRAFRANLSWLRETPTAPATDIQHATFNLFLYERRGPLEEPWKYLVGLGLSPIDGVREGGFWPVEVADGVRTRWTRGEAWLDVPLRKGWSPRSLELDIVGLPPTGTWLTVRANGTEIYNALIEKAPAALSLGLPGKLRKRLRLEFVSDTFRPSAVDGSSDDRELGVRIKGLTLR
jgi:4-amino-4-deoxy-L-arabinose transferase-like glycosyltransferase